MNELDFLEQKAVDSAVNLDWVKAIDFNKQILNIEKNNVAALLRLGFAHMQAKNKTEAEQYYNKVLKIQPNNPIALENLEKINVLQSTSKKNSGGTVQLNPSLFLEIPGKTKSIILVNLGQKDILAELTIGQEVLVKAKKRKIEIRTSDGEYIGTLPDDVSRRLLAFIEAESTYTAYIKEANLNRVVVFMKEEKKGKKVLQYVSFPQNVQAALNISETTDEDSAEEGDDDVDTDHIQMMADALKEEEEIHYSNEDEESESEE